MATLKGSQASTNTSGSAARGTSRPYLEIQYHPGDIRRGVRYVFLSRKQVGWWIAGGLAYVAALVFAITVTPTVISDRLSERQYTELLAERGRRGDQLKVLVERMAALETEASQALAKMSKIHLAYGLANESRGQGGYPIEAPDPPPRSVKSIYRQDVERGYELTGTVGGQMGALRVFLDEVQSFETANSDQVNTTPSLSPLHPDTFVMTSPFGTRRSPFTKEIDFHAGIDMAATIGTPIYAPADGTVTYAGRIPLRQSVAWWRYGNVVAIQHGENLMTLFGHCDEILLFDERKRTKKTVKRGEVIATVGNTGWSTNPHLHYEVRWRDEAGKWHPVDPRIYILDHRWRDEERILIQARKAPSSQDYEPLPRAIGR